MFKNIFSFSGRIRRLEYGLTYLFYFAALGISSLLFYTSEFLEPVAFLIIITNYWIILAQGCKRCHDLGNNGFYQLIPFYIFIMLFQDGQSHVNNYGPNPKSEELKEKKESRKRMSFQNPGHLVILEIIFIVLFATLILSINNIIFSDYDTFTTLSYFLMPIPSFLIFLLISHNDKPLPKETSVLVNQQLIFAFIYYITIRLYAIIFRLSEVDIETILFEPIAIALIFGLTYIPLGIYSLIFKSPSVKNA